MSDDKEEHKEKYGSAAGHSPLQTVINFAMPFFPQSPSVLGHGLV